MTPLEAFVEALGPARDVDQVAAEERLHEMVGEARARWPQLGVDPIALARAAASRIREDESAIEGLRALRADALWLASRCATGDAAAIAAFEAEILAPAVRRAGARVRGAAIDDAQQLIAQQLLVPDEHGRRAIDGFGARSKLGRWLEVIATRRMLRLVKRQSRETDLSGRDVLQRLTSSDPELSHLKRTYAAELERALEQAVHALGAKERNLLRYHFVDGLSSDEIAPVYNVHRATVSRWLVAACEQLEKHARADLVDRLGLKPAEVDSVLRLVRSRVDPSFARWLEA